MEYRYKTSGTCSKEMIVDLDGDTIRKVQVIGGCNGNLKGISSLLQGMRVEDAIARLQGIRCGMRPTSCPDQLAQALKQSI